MLMLTFCCRGCEADGDVRRARGAHHSRKLLELIRGRGCKVSWAMGSGPWALRRARSQAAAAAAAAAASSSSSSSSS
eukprot:12406423-Karenia_brevis.AAC.1